jgi:hypothetical protein
MLKKQELIKNPDLAIKILLNKITKQSNPTSLLYAIVLDILDSLWIQFPFKSQFAFQINCFFSTLTF